MNFLKRFGTRLFGKCRNLIEPDPPSSVAVDPFYGEGTVLVAEMRGGHAQFAAALSVRELAAAYIQHADMHQRVIAKHGGVVSMVVGDAVQAYWRQSNDNHEHISNALTAAKALMSMTSKDLAYRVCLGTGTLAGDYFGPIRQFQLIGSAVIEAERLSNFPSDIQQAILFSTSTQSGILDSGLPLTLGVLPNQAPVFAYKE